MRISTQNLALKIFFKFFYILSLRQYFGTLAKSCQKSFLSFNKANMVL